MTANPNASADAKKLLAWLTALPDRADKRVVSGQHTGFHPRDILNDHERNVAGLEAQAGKRVALIGASFGLDATPEQIHAANQEVLIPHWQAGGLVTVDHHPYNPWTGGYFDDLRQRDLVELITPGTAVNDTWMAELDKVAAGLAELRDAGVVVLWRPFHEMTFTKMFWWDSGAHGGEWIGGVYYPVIGPYIIAWRHMFRYFSEDKGLDNLLWVYCPAGETDNYNPVDSMWPGDDYVDVAGLDVYDDDLAFGSNDQPYQRLLQKGKPLGFFEVGPGASRDGSWDTTRIIGAIKEAYPDAVLWQSWCSWDFEGGEPRTHIALVDNQDATALLGDPWVITRDKVDWRTEMEEDVRSAKDVALELNEALPTLDAHVEAARAAMTEMETRIAELQTQMVPVSALLTELQDLLVG
jgi:mannan endo-1,4-beta-mannosidase